MIDFSHRHKSIYVRKVGYILILMFGILLASCNSAEPPLKSIRLSQPESSPENIEIEPLTTITFQVDIPPDTPPGQPIMLSILDEVTGLALNITRMEMQKVGDTTYSITLPFPVGATIKYRYARQDTFTAEEHTTDQRPVRYRIYQVDGPGIVKDVVSNWSDSTYEGSTGRIMGKVSDEITEKPIPNLLVTAGGAQTVTSSQGEYLLEGLPPGLHNLVFYAFDGTYHTYQQGAQVAAQSTTPADIRISPSPLVKLIFTAVVPEGTLPAVPVRLAGNLVQLGNTFADLSGGMNTLASRMPTLTALPDGRYAVQIELPAGAFIQYKYTLGDGFWNAEYTSSGDFRLRSLTVPDENTLIEDQIDNWGSSSNVGPVIFDLAVPATTPEFDTISIQFNPFGWTEPIPMWKLEDNHWVYMLFSPITRIEDFSYRYCRNDQCNRADDALTPGANSSGRLVSISNGTQTVRDTVDAWHWYDPELSGQDTELPEIKPRQEDFMAAVELQSYYHPSFGSRLPVSYKEIKDLGSNWIVMSPTWTFTRQNPPVLEAVTRLDQSWTDLTYSIQKAQAFEFQVALNPAPNFPVEVQEWWSNVTPDFAWWQVWFERYQNFILSFADKAQQEGVDALILGGDWLLPALPGGKLSDGTPSGVPGDAEDRWREIINEVRQRYSGTLIWSLPAEHDGIEPPPFIEDLDQIYLLWSLPLTDQPDVNFTEISKAAAEYMDSEVFLLDISLEMPIILAVAYPSADGGLQNCVHFVQNNEETSCFHPRFLDPPFPDNQNIKHDLDEQSAAYAAILTELNKRQWIDGVVSVGYYLPAALQDKSNSIHGKPAQQILSDWYRAFHPGENSSD